MKISDKTILDAVDPDQLADTRNRTQFPNYEAHGQYTFEQFLRPGPEPTVSCPYHLSIIQAASH